MKAILPFISVMTALTIATLNVNGLRNNFKREIVFDYFIRRKVNILFLQETHSEKKDENQWLKQWRGDIAFSHGQRNSKGVAILTSEKKWNCVNQ